MNPVEFCYWLRGSTEQHPMAQPTTEQWASIREHVALATSDLSPAPINMAADRFCQWLHGHCQLGMEATANPDQWLMIQERLRQVFVKVTPMRSFHIDQGGLRTMELRPEDRLREAVRDVNWPLTSTLTLTC
jgi:hypothetical protein